MRKKTYLSFKDLRAFYDSDTGKLRLTSGDSRLASRRWGLTLDRDTYEKAVLEQELAAAGLSPQRASQSKEVRVLAGSPTVGNQITMGAGGTEDGVLGPYIGRTTDGSDEAVFYSPLADLHSNRSPVCLISGAPGSGKTWAALRILDGLLLQGATIVQMDPGGDLMPYAISRDGSQVLDLRNQPAGLLNPFELEDEALRIDAIMTTLLTLLGEEEGITLAQRGLLSRAVLEAMKLPRPNLSSVMHRLSALGSEAQAVFDMLYEVRERPFASLIFQSSKHPGFSIKPGLNLVMMRGLDLPYTNLAPNDYSVGNRLGVVLYRLTHLHLRQALRQLPRATPKALVADGAWLLMTSRWETKQLREAFADGRTSQLATVLITQDSADFNAVEPGLQATRMFFRQSRIADVSYFTQHTDDPDWQDDEQVMLLLNSLNVGECLMEDAYGRRARVQISAGPQSLRDAFSGNPETRKRTHLS